MEPSIFTRIINGEIPCHKVFEDDRVLAFLDISPFTEGHTLVVPKQQVDHLWDLDNELYQHLLYICKLVADKQRTVLNPGRVAMIVEGFEVPHAHIHVLPASEGLEATIAHKISQPTDEAFKAMAKRLAF